MPQGYRCTIPSSDQFAGAPAREAHEGGEVSAVQPPAPGAAAAAAAGGSACGRSCEELQGVGTEDVPDGTRRAVAGAEGSGGGDAGPCKKACVSAPVCVMH